ncbi:MAG TPA: DUF4917 family protein [Gemmatimonadaceae bacterium]|nr:DUF4917 family protein [Gemmatimonadaceae bacterium]
MVKLLTFDEAIGKCAGKTKPHLLLGNGFSRACRNDIFAYDALLDEADFSGLSPYARPVFDTLKTTDFEAVIRALRNAAAVLRLYGPDQQHLAQLLDKDADDLREVLVTTIASTHPEFPAEIADDRYGACRTFLAHFGRIYTLNYDLLLYWALMHSDVGPPVSSDDGFRASPDDPDADYVTWETEGGDSQNINYLHGALHLFDAGTELKKYTWSRTGIRLIEQVRQAMATHMYPVFVSEGESDSKLEKIRHSDYLSRALRSLNKIRGTMFIYGHSLAKNDEHILKMIERGGLSRLFVSLYGDSASPDNTRIVERARRMIDARPKGRPLTVEFYEAASARVWG